MLGLLLSAAVAVRAAGQAMDSLSVSRRIVAAASLAAKEYAIGVAPRGGRVTAPEEVSEARQFLEQARLDVGALPAAVRVVADSDLAALEAMIDRVAPPDSVSQRAGTLVQRIAAPAGGALGPHSPRPPPIAPGAAAFSGRCGPCHTPTCKGA